MQPPPGPGIRFELLLDFVEQSVDPGLELLDVYDGGEPNLNHYRLAELACAGAIIVTTNFDGLIERALGNGPCRVRFRPADFEGTAVDASRTPGAPEVWHLHGMLRDPVTGEGCRDSIIASVTGCWTAREGFRLEAGKGNALRRLLQNRDLLVVGYSGADDYDIAPALETISSARTLVWCQHVSGDDLARLELPNLPWVIDHYPDGGMGYRDPALNLLAVMLGSGRRALGRTFLLQADTTPVLAQLAPQHDAVRDQAGEATCLREHFQRWGERQLPNELLRVKLALLLAGSAGLHGESERLADEFLGRGAELMAQTGISPATVGLFVELCCLVTQVRPQVRGAVLGPLLEIMPDQPLVEAVLLVEEARGLSEAERFAEAIERLERSLRLRLALPGHPDVHVVHHDLAWAYLGQAEGPADLVKAQQHSEAALAVSRKLSSLEGIARSLRLMARVHEQQGLLHLALDCFVESLQVARQSARPGLIATSAGELGLFLSLQGQHEAAVSPLSEAWRYHARTSEHGGLVQIGSHLAQCLEVVAAARAPDAGKRSLLADCVVWQSADQLGDFATATIAPSRIGDGLRRERIKAPPAGGTGTPGGGDTGTADWVEAIRQSLIDQDIRI